MNLQLHILDQNRKAVRSPRLEDMFFRRVPNRVLPDAVAKVMACRGQSVNGCPDDSGHIGIDEPPLCESGVKQQCDVMAANHIGNSIKMDSSAVIIFVRFDVQDDRTDDVHVSFHSDVRMRPNDPKLSDRRGWRAGCGVARTRDVEQERAPREVDAWSVEIAASVTAAPVRCSAWLGVSFWVEAIANPTRKEMASVASIRMTGDERRALLDGME